MALPFYLFPDAIAAMSDILLYMKIHTPAYTAMPRQQSPQIFGITHA